MKRLSNLLDFLVENMDEDRDVSTTFLVDNCHIYNNDIELNNMLNILASGKYIVKCLDVVTVTDKALSIYQ